MLVSELDEDVFEAGSQRADLGHNEAGLQQLLAKMFGIEAIFDEGVNGLAKDGGAADAGDGTGSSQGARDFGGGDFHAISSSRLDVGKLAKSVGSAVGDDLAKINVSNVAAAFGLVHVMGGD